MDFFSLPLKSQTHLSDGNVQSYVCFWPCCLLSLKFPRNVTPDKSLLKTSRFTSELLPLQKGKFHSALSPSYLTNSPLTGQQPLAFPIPQTLNHLSKEVPGSRLAPSSSFCYNVSDMPFLLWSILLCTAKLTLPPFPLPLSAHTLCSREPGHQHHLILRPITTWKIPTAQMHSTCHSLWNSDLVLQHIAEQVLYHGKKQHFPSKQNLHICACHEKLAKSLTVGAGAAGGNNVLYLRVVSFG